MRRIAIFVGVFGVGVGVVLGLALTRLTESAYARETCNTQSLKGPYGYAISGSAFLPPGNRTAKEVADAAFGGRVVFDGDGHLSGADWVSLNGNTSPRDYTGTYAIDSDCSGHAAIAGTPATFNFTLVDNGRQIKLIETDPGFVISGTLRKAKQDCTLETLHGSYGYAVQGQTFVPPGTANEVADSTVGGRATFNGDGTGVGVDTVSINGMIITPRTYTSTYSLNSDCTGTETMTTITPTPHPPPGHLHIVVVDDGRTVEVVVTDPGNVVAGESVRQ